MIWCQSSLARLLTRYSDVLSRGLDIQYDLPPRLPFSHVICDFNHCVSDSEFLMVSILQYEDFFWVQVFSD